MEDLVFSNTGNPNSFDVEDTRVFEVKPCSRMRMLYQAVRLQRNFTNNRYEAIKFMEYGKKQIMIMELRRNDA